MIRISDKLRLGSLCALLVITLIAVAMPERGNDGDDLAVGALDRPQGQPGRPQGPPLADQTDSGRDPMERALNKLRARTLEDSVENPFVNKSWYVPPPPAPQAAVAPVTPPPPPAPTAPSLPFSYMGKLLAEDQQPSLFFLVRGDKLYAVAEGDVIDNTYRVDGLKSGQLGLTYLPLDIKQFIAVGSDS